MAKLGGYYALCPLIDTKEIFGIVDDANRGTVIATLGKNIASKYKLSDQRQLSCWRTKEKFSSPVLYDKKQSKYVAVFNQSYVKLWENDDNLDKVKKYKFNKQIHTLISDGEDIFVIFVRGAILKLEDALEQRKDVVSEFIEADLVDVIHRKVGETFYVGIITNEEGYSLSWTTFSNNRANNNYNRIPLVHEDLSLLGYVFHANNDTIIFLTFWSDGSVYSCNLDNNIKEPTVGELLTVIDSISMKHSLSVLSLDENYLAVYGADINEEGALLIIYNTQFKVTQTRQPFKMFTDSTKIWRIENNIFVPVGQNLAVIPFYLESEQLAALVGSHKVSQEDINSDVKVVHEIEVASWDERCSVKEKKIDQNLRTRIEDMINQGIPESNILEYILPDIFEKNDIKLLSLILNYFSDISEKFLVKILKYLLHLDDKFFNNVKCELDTIPSVLQPLERIKIINCVLNKSFTEELLIPYLRMDLDLGDVITLIEYINAMWSLNEIPLPQWVLRDARLLEWSCSLIDSNYQKIILSKNESILRVFENLRDIVTCHLNKLQDLRSLEPYLVALQKGSLINRESNVNSNYGIEQIALY